MKPSRTTRLLAAVIAAFSLLFTQLAVASYVCPAMPGMANCAQVDKSQPSLCAAHAHGTQQSLDQPDLPQLPPFHPAGLALTIEPADAPALSVHDMAALPTLAHATAPPIAIRHCCFRN